VSNEPTFSIDEAGITTLDWNGERPETVVMSSASIEAIVEAHNEMVRKIKALEMLTSIFRLGRRPNRRDWEEAGMPQKFDPDVRIDIMRRKPV
jgi:hypothetical protein